MNIAQWTLLPLILITSLTLTIISVKHDYSKKIFEIQQNFFGREQKTDACTFYALWDYTCFDVSNQKTVTTLTAFLKYSC